MAITYCKVQELLPALNIGTHLTLKSLCLAHSQHPKSCFHGPFHTSTYINMGSPTPSISGITHFRSNAFASTILNIFCTLIEADVEQKMSEACIAFAKRFAYMIIRLAEYTSFSRHNTRHTCFVISSCSSLGNVEKVSNLVPIRNGIAVCGEYTGQLLGNILHGCPSIETG